MINDGGILTTLDPTTGAVAQAGPPARRGRPVLRLAGGGRRQGLLRSKSGIASVLEAGPEQKPISVADLAEEVAATPALADGRIYLRTRTRSTASARHARRRLRRPPRSSATCPARSACSGSRPRATRPPPRWSRTAAASCRAWWRARRRCTRRTAASCPSSPRATTSRRSCRSWSRRWRTRATRFEELAAVAVTQGPGLVGSLLVGLQVAKAIALVHGSRSCRCTTWPATSLRRSWPTATSRCPRSRWSSREGTRASSRFPRKASTGGSAARATTPPARRSTRWRSSSGLGYPGGPVIDRLARGRERPRGGVQGRPHQGRGERLLVQRDQDRRAAPREARADRARRGSRAGAAGRARPRRLLPAGGGRGARARARARGARAPAAQPDPDGRRRRELAAAARDRARGARARAAGLHPAARRSRPTTPP